MLTVILTLTQPWIDTISISGFKWQKNVRGHGGGNVRMRADQCAVSVLVFVGRLASVLLDNVVTSGRQGAWRRGTTCHVAGTATNGRPPAAVPARHNSTTLWSAVRPPAKFQPSYANLRCNPEVFTRPFSVTRPDLTRQIADAPLLADHMQNADPTRVAVVYRTVEQTRPKPRMNPNRGRLLWRWMGKLVTPICLCHMQ